MKVVNLTPHEVAVAWEDGGSLAYPPSGEVARLIPRDPDPVRALEDALGVQVVTAPHFEDSVLTGLPLKMDDGETAILVSMPVGQFLQNVPDLWRGPVLGPDSGPTAIRDAGGQIKAVRRLVCYNPKNFIQ